MLKTNFFLFFIVLLLNFNLTAQSNNCNNNTGPEVISGTTCTTSAFNTTSNGNYWATPTGCDAGNFGDRWVWFTATSLLTTITYSPNQAADDPIITLFTGACDPNVTSLACSNTGTNGVDETIIFATTVGLVYRVRLQNRATNGDMSGTICVFGSTAPSPVNEEPCTATILPVNSTCINTLGSNINASATTGVTDPGCANYSATNQDVWYSITVPASGLISVTTSGESGGLSDGGLAAYSGLCGTLSLIQCNDDSNGSFENITLSGQTPGATIWYRVWDYDGGTGNFNICATEPTPPPNDTPCSATVLAINATCTNTLGTNIGSSPTAGVPDPLCADYNTTDGDVWFTVTIPASGNVIVSTSENGGFIDGGLAAYSGACGTLTLVECNDDGNDEGNGLFEKITLTGQTPGDIIWFRVWDYDSGFGTFDICAIQAPVNLPVQMLSFNGNTYEKENHLTWSTASEENNDYFIIEKSIDGIHYSEIGKVNGSGNSTSRINYDFSDFEFNIPLIYYKLKQVDFDGSENVTGIIKVTRELTYIFSYPNPATNELNFTFNSDYNGDVTIDYIDVSGRVFSEKVIINSNMNYKSTLFQYLSSGIYFTRISENGIMIQTMKIIKE